MSVLLGLFVVVLVNSLLLLLFDESTAAVYIGLVLVHVALGVLLVAPVALFLALHVRKMPLRWNRAATVAGLFTAGSVSALLATGFWLVIEGATAMGGWVLPVHIGAAVAVVLGFTGHVSLKRGVRYHFLEWGGLWQEGLPQALRHPFSLVLGAGLLLSAVFLVKAWWPQRPDIFRRAETSERVLSPAGAVLAGHEFLEAEELMTSQACADCHGDIYQQWKASAHHFSSFNNPYYRQTVEYLMAHEEPGTVRWCASCHDPVVLFSGKMQDGTFNMDSEAAQAGITCLSCHGIRALRDKKGNGRYVMAPPDRYPFAGADDPVRQWLHRKLIRIRPEPHRQAMLRPVQRTAEFCGTCHKVGVPPAVNDYRWKRGQNQYDSWQMSGISGSTVRSFYLPETRETCVTCHMPLVPSHDVAADGGLVRSHRFAAANATLPALKGYPKQVHAVRTFLKDSVVTLDLFRVVVNGTAYGPTEALPVLEGGDQVEVTLVVRNRGVGHRFPAGTNDSNQPWIQLRALSAEGRAVLASGAVGPQGRVDSTAHFFGAVLVDRHSRPIDKRNIQDWVATVYSNTVPPGAAQAVHYRFTVPAGTRITALEAALRYRKFKRGYHRWVFRGKEEVPPQPIVTMDVARREAGKAPPSTGASSTRPLWERWDDYGIRLLLEGDTRGALRAFARVSELAPKSPEGPINRARVFLAEGQLSRAAEAREEAERRRPGYLKTAYFRGVLYQKRGAYEKALAAWQRVEAAYPRDRVLLMDIARVYYLMGRFEEALGWLDRALEIDPEYLPALYHRMLALGALGREEALEEAREKYLYHKEDEAAQAEASRYKRRHPMDNREAQPIHYHRLHPVDAPSEGGREAVQVRLVSR